MTEGFCAFGGDPAVKAALIEQVRPRWIEGKLLALPILHANAEHDIYSIGSTLAGSTDRAQFEAKTGIPVDVALTCEMLVGTGTEMTADANGVHVTGSDAVMALGTAWLEATRPGADLSGVLPRYIMGVVERLFAPDHPLADHIGRGSRAAGEDILALWRRELSGQAVPATEWRAVRGAAVGNSEGVDDPWEATVAQTLESLAWPVEGLSAEAVTLLQALVTHVLAFARQPFREEADRRAQVDVMFALQRIGRADGGLDEAALTTLFEDRPDALHALRSSAEPAVRERAAEVGRRARTATDPIVLREFGALVALIEQA